MTRGHDHVTEQIGTIRILTAVNRPPGGGLDALATSLPGLTWNQVFLEVDPLSRRWQIHVTAGGTGTSVIRLPERRKTIQPESLSHIPASRVTQRPESPPHWFHQR